MKYLFVLDFSGGNAYRYDIRGKAQDDFEDFIIEKGHSISNVDWMTTDNPHLIIN